MLLVQETSTQAAMHILCEKMHVICTDGEAISATLPQREQNRQTHLIAEDFGWDKGEMPGD